MGGTAEMLRDGGNGILIDSKNDEQLLTKLLLLIEDRDLRERLSRNAMETIRTGFSEDLMIEKLEALFENVIAKRKS